MPNKIVVWIDVPEDYVPTSKDIVRDKESWVEVPRGYKIKEGDTIRKIETQTGVIIRRLVITGKTIRVTRNVASDVKCKRCGSDDVTLYANGIACDSCGKVNQDVSY